MDTGETTDAKLASRRGDADREDPIYDGAAGQTRIASVHVTIPGGYVRSVQVYTAVNVGTHPDLKDAALAGGLHRFEGGEELAIPFVFHDPAERRFALVLPESLRHRELVERAKLLHRLADDTASPIPPYVREAIVVIGPVELRDYLAQRRRDAHTSQAREAELEARASALATREAELMTRESSIATRDTSLTKKEDELSRRRDEVEKQVERLVEREKRLHVRAEDVTRREDEVRLAHEEIEATRRDVRLREEELERRLEMLRQREAELAEAHAAASRPRSVPPPRPASEPPPQPAVEDADDDDIEEIDEIEAVQTDSNVQLAEAVEMIDDGRDRISATDVEEIVDEDDVEEIEDVEAVREVTGVEAISQEPSDDARTRVAESGPAPAPEATPPPAFLDDPGIELAATLTDRVWLFARVDDGHRDAFRDGADLLVQLSVVHGYPVAILALVSPTEGRPYVRRAALDPKSTDDRRVLAALRQRFEATVAVFSAAGRFERTVEVEAPRRVNVAMLLERADRTGDQTDVDAATALERALAVPPPVRDDGAPFRTEEPPPTTSAGESAARLDELVPWITPEKLEHVMLSLSVPRDVVDGTIRRVLSDAVHYGLALPGPLVSRAVSVGVAAEPGELVERQIEAFRETSESRGHGGLSAERVASNWEQLLAAAADAEVPIESDIHEVAWRAIREVRGETTGAHAADVDPAKLPQMGAPELVVLLDHPDVRRHAALELCRRSEPELLDSLMKAVRKMPRADVVRVVPRIAEFGEAAGDVLIDGLAAKKTFVRQAAALSLGHLKLRRAVVPLVHLLGSEPSEVWRELARVLGEFGTGAFRALSRGVKDPKGDAERFTLALAHLANNGCAKQVEQLAADRDGRTADTARLALTLRERAGQDAAEVRGQRPISGDDAVRAFSQRFYAELAGTAPDVDLVDVVE